MWHPLQAARWEVTREAVGEDGRCSAGQLAAVDLSPKEYAKFQAGIAKLAMEREKSPNDFQTFVDWSERNGPHHVIIDGANVALFGQSTSGLKFQFHQIEKTVAAFRQSHPDKKPLVVRAMSSFFCSGTAPCCSFFVLASALIYLTSTFQKYKK